jgi:parvulin-like peptidyl-prolyl isomerase
MRYHGLLLSLAVGLAVGGCQAGRPGVATVAPDMAALLDQPAGPGQATARGQKSEKRAGPSGGVLDLGPDAPGADAAGRIVRIRAVVNNEPILDEELKAAAYQGLARATTDAERAEILNAKLAELIDREVVLQDAFSRLKGKGDQYLKKLKEAARNQFEEKWLREMMRGNKFENEEEFKKFLRANNMPLELVQRQWERNFIAMEYLRYKIEPHINQIGHWELQDYYQKHQDEFRVDDEVQWQDLFVLTSKDRPREAAREFAEGLAARARKGEEFAKLAKVHDEGDSSLRENAEGIGRKRGAVKPPEAEPMLFSMHDGEVRVVETDNGFHVVRLVKRQHAGVLPFDKKGQKLVRDKLRNQVFQREMKRFVNDLKRKAVIEIAR